MNSLICPKCGMNNVPKKICYFCDSTLIMPAINIVVEYDGPNQHSGEFLIELEKSNVTDSDVVCEFHDRLREMGIDFNRYLVRNWRHA